MARERGLRVYVKPLGELEFKYGIEGGNASVTLNENIPYGFKQQVLAYRIAFWEISGLIIDNVLSESDIKELWYIARRKGEKLLRRASRMAYPSTLNTVEGWNKLTRASREKKKFNMPIAV